jgi:hypothetical protein
VALKGSASVSRVWKRWASLRQNSATAVAQVPVGLACMSWSASPHGQYSSGGSVWLRGDSGSSPGTSSSSPSDSVSEPGSSGGGDCGGGGAAGGGRRKAWGRLCWGASGRASRDGRGADGRRSTGTDKAARSWLGARSRWRSSAAGSDSPLGYCPDASNREERLLRDASAA